MCGRFTQTRPLVELIAHFRFVAEEGLEEVAVSYNLAPSRPAVVVVEGTEGRVGRAMQWGFIPGFAREPGRRPINARAETAAERPMFRRALATRRCIVPADGFYEWSHRGGRGQPYRFVLRSGEVFGLAGLWDLWVDPQGRPVRTFCVLTTRANSLVGAVHDRMPVVLARGREDLWLDPAVRDPAMLAPLWEPFPAEEMAAYPVHPRVGDPRVDEPGCIAPWDGAPPLPGGAG